MLYQGSCHCGAVQFEVDAPVHLEVDECNCSICSKSGDLHLIRPLSKFRLLSGEDDLTLYQFNTQVARHTFCKHCGIKAFYVPRSNPDGISVNVRCLSTPILSMTVSAFDGQNWEANAASVTHKSRE